MTIKATRCPQCLFLHITTFIFRNRTPQALSLDSIHRPSEASPIMHPINIRPLTQARTPHHTFSNREVMDSTIYINPSRLILHTIRIPSPASNRPFLFPLRQITSRRQLLLRTLMPSTLSTFTTNRRYPAQIQVCQARTTIHSTTLPKSVTAPSESASRNS